MYRNSNLSTLRNATLTIGVTCLFFNVSGLIKLAIEWATLSGHKLTQSGFLVPTEARDAADARRREHTEQRLPVDEIFTALVVVAVLQLLFDLTLIHGARVSPTQPTTGRRCVFAWVIFRAILHGLLSLAFIVLLVIANVLRNDRGEPLLTISVWKTVSFGIGLALLWGCWTVVVEFHRRLRDTVAGDVAFPKTKAEGKLRFCGPAEPTVAAAGMA